MLPNAVVLRALRHKVSIGHGDLGRFYTLLGHWCERQSQASNLQEQLKLLPLLYTFDGRWVPMTGPAFFSRSPGSPQIPRGFLATILHEACTTGLTAAEVFLKSIGVQPFRWREVILHSLLPTLSGKPSDRQIGAAHQFLKTYF
jgi:hypothetical protein